MQKKTKDKPVKKVSAKAPAAKKPVKKASTASVAQKPDIKTVPSRTQGSIAPPKENLVSALDLFKKTTKRRQGAAPAVARLSPSAALKPSLEKNQVQPATPKDESLKKEQPPLPHNEAKSTLAASSPPLTSAPKPTDQPISKPAAPNVQKPNPGQGQNRPYQRPGGGQYRRPPNQHHRHSGKTHQKPQENQGSAVPSAAPVNSALSGAAPDAKPALKPLEVSSMITVRELAEKMEVKPNDLIKKLMGLGIFATINQRLEVDAASIIAQEFGFEIKAVSMYKEDELEQKAREVETPENLKPRPPVVTVMGHVDHGKTSLLDAIRSSRVAEGEAGGITQHIGAYQVKTPKGEITFLDTPGHAAFTAMRARGVKATDIVIVVVSAVDGAMPQTIEAIDHAKAAGVPIIVAVNKIDLPGANPQKIRQELSQQGLMPEEWGGKTIFVDVSAKKRMNLDNLLEMISIQAQVLELRSNPDRPGHGVIIEAEMDAKRGSVATLLVQSGTAKVGDSFVAGLCHGKIKAMFNYSGERVERAGPSTPVSILGVTGTPQAGDVFSVVSDDRQSREIAEKRKLLHREQTLAHQRHMTLVGLKSQGGTAKKELAVVLKADVQGSLQALKDSLENLSSAECRVRLIHSGVGNANESDVLLAEASDAVILLFHADIDSRAQEVASRDGIEVRKYEIIYDLIADVKAAVEGLLEPEIVEVPMGKADVRQVFKVKGGAVAGSFVLDGKIMRGAFARVFRAGKLIYEGKISSLKRFKDDVKEVEKNFDCGVCVDNFSGFELGDQILAIAKESRTRRLNPESPHV
ncbi:MAG: translation initiation factor IF-2 [Elusimicrobiota bacterium]